MKIANTIRGRMRLRTLLGSAGASLLLCLGLSSSALANGTIGTPTPVDAGLSCKDFDTAGILTEMVINPLPVGIQAHTDGTLTVDTIHFESTSGWLLYWEQLSTGQSIHSVSISGGGSAMLYSYDPPVTADAGLHLPGSSTLVSISTTHPYPQINQATFCYSTPGETGFEGCTLGYWKVKKHHDSWPSPYATYSNLQNYFGLDAPDTSLLTALSFQGGPGVDGGKRILLKQAVAALLNSASGGVDYPLTTAQVTSQVIAALATGDREIMLSLATTLDAYNNQGCPLN